MLEEYLQRLEEEGEMPLELANDIYDNFHQLAEESIAQVEDFIENTNFEAAYAPPLNASIYLIIITKASSGRSSSFS